MGITDGDDNKLPNDFFDQTDYNILSYHPF